MQLIYVLTDQLNHSKENKKIVFSSGYRMERHTKRHNIEIVTFSSNVNHNLRL